jgi:AbrB family looped-hinge helix DNA binding protein
MNSSYSITSKSQVTIPREIRKKLGVGVNDRVAFSVEGGRAYMTKVPTLEEVRKMLHDDLKRRGFNKTVTQADMNKAHETFIEQGLRWE